MMMNLLFVCGLCVFFGLALAQIVFVTKASAVVRRFSLWAMLLASILFLAFSLNIVLHNSTFSLNLYELTNDLRFSFLVDRLAAYFMLIISLVSGVACLYSLGYIEHNGTNTGKNFLVAMMSLFIISMLLIVASDNTFSFLFFWEIMSSTSFFMVLFEREKPDTRKSALFYFVMTQMSTVFLMFGFIAIHHATGSFDIGSVTGVSPFFKGAVFLSLFIGFGSKRASCRSINGCLMPIPPVLPTFRR